MHCINKEKASALRVLRRRILLQFLLISLILNLSVGMPRAAMASRAFLHPLGAGYLPLSPRQNPFEGVGMIAEGQALMMQQTRQGLTQSIVKFKEAFAFFQKDDNKIGMGGARFSEGVALDSLGQYREALSALLDAGRYMEEAGFSFMQPIAWAALGSVYASLGETDKALDFLNRALPAVRFTKNPQFIAYAVKGLGDVYVQLGQKSKALEYLNEALGLYRELGFWRYESQVLVLISVLKTSLGQSKEAIESASAAIDISKKNNAPDVEAYGRFPLGAAHASIGKLDEAIKEYTLALALLQAQKDGSGEATVLNNLGLIFSGQGKFDLAMDHFNKSLTISERIGEPRLAAYSLNNMATIYQRRGEPLNAIRQFEKALAIAEGFKDKRLKAAIASNMADVNFMIIREYALNSIRESARIFREIEEPAREAEALISLADGYAATGRYKEALDVLRPVLESRTVAKDPARQGYVLRQMGYIYSNTGERDEGLKYYALALSQFDAAGDEAGKVDLYAAWGAACVQNGEYLKAADLLSRGLALARAARYRQGETRILLVLGSMHEKQGNLAQAEKIYAEQIAVSESLRSSAHIEELKTHVGSVSATLLTPAILLKFRQGKLREAFELTERVRARTFLDQLNNSRIDLRTGSDPGLIDQEQSLRFEIRSLEKQLRDERRSNPYSDAVKSLAASVKEKEDAYTALLIRLKASNPDYADLRSYSPVPLSRIQELLGPQTTMISYFVTADKTLAFVVSANSLHAEEILVKEADLRAQIDWFRSFPNLGDTNPGSLKQLDTWLISRVRQHIKTANVVIVPHGILHYLPFAALTDGNRYFGDDHTIYHLPSASTLPSLRRRIRHSIKRVLSVAQSQAPGLPFLRYADEEAGIVAKLYHNQPLLTGRATKAEFLKRAGAYNVIHIAAHAELNATSPLFSRIMLSSSEHDSGEIEVREIYGMGLDKTNLVALSACETHLGAQSKGDDIVGLNRAFIYAGASSVIASLWTVDDKATSLFMETFYGHLKQGRSAAAALQAAQTATRRKYPHPYYWAPFVLTGDPGMNNRR